MLLTVTLMLLPCIAALVMLAARTDSARDVLTIAFAAAIAILSIVFAAMFMGSQPTVFMLPPEYTPWLSRINLILDLTVSAFIVCYALKYRRTITFALIAIQIVLTTWLEFTMRGGEHFTSQMYIDSFTVIMVLIIGIVGSGIIVYALGYMKDWQAHHEDQKDRRPWFFAIMFAFLSAMYNIVISDDFGWIYTAWEITTLCSFLLIGFAKTEEALNNAFLQIKLNMIGGIAFQVGIAFLSLNGLPMLFSEFIAFGSAGNAIVAFPVACLALAGMTKAAQMPFHSWLLGAMVAPTPTSALLHSSTMVKAGTFLLLRLAPLFVVCPSASYMTIFVGGFTFLMASLMAISQTNAKRVLAYSTIANLGLITACAGVGTPEAVWAGVFLVIFHAVAKSLLFLCVGTAEHHIGSRDIEDMDELFNRMPRLARLMMLGIMGMFVAPFGMLISKWATLQSFASTGQVVLIALLAFGSAATFLFWAKWLGKLSGIAAHAENIELDVHKSEWAAQGLMAALVALCCVCMPLLSTYLVEPFLVNTYGTFGNTIGMDNMLLMGLIVALLVVVLFGTLGKKPVKQTSIYLAGISVDNEARTFKGSLGNVRTATGRNWYLADIFGEAKLDYPSVVLPIIAIAIGICASFHFAMTSPTTVVSLVLYATVGTTGNTLLRILIGTLAFAILAPVIGCLLAGIDRKLTAKMQGRVGPPLLQPYYDVQKLIAKDDVHVNSVEGTYVTAALIFAVLAGGIFYGGGNFLLCVFLVTLSGLMFILAAYSTRSPYAEVGADREALQVMSYEPMLMFLAVGLFLTLGTFDASGVFLYDVPPIVALWPIFIGLMFILTIKLRKSPFDLSYSHHAHQELVKGITTEMSGKTLAKIEVMHWCESVLFLGWVGMFFVCHNPLSLVLAVLVAFLAFFLEIVIDNNFARVKWQSMLKWAWIISGVLGIANIAALVIFNVL
ncbi:proton-conducting transporter transmembrane domain-containing protein [Slackia heliotrinireducens]|uniref:proton-conducting transporter transmembrane domain-containing protein n=1 Tax=Slackia heliotrinireducens TaxID=84110 RepID=UPI003314FCB5